MSRKRRRSKGLRARSWVGLTLIGLVVVGVGGYIVGQRECKASTIFDVQGHGWIQLAPGELWCDSNAADPNAGAGPCVIEKREGNRVLLAPAQ